MIGGNSVGGYLASRILVFESLFLSSSLPLFLSSSLHLFVFSQIFCLYRGLMRVSSLYFRWEGRQTTRMGCRRTTISFRAISALCTVHTSRPGQTGIPNEPQAPNAYHPVAPATITAPYITKPQTTPTAAPYALRSNPSRQVLKQPKIKAQPPTPAPSTSPSLSPSPSTHPPPSNTVPAKHAYPPRPHPLPQAFPPSPALSFPQLPRPAC
ncbi:hypothetical protein EJ06DRAFT_158805 [Trichodelitschia bisporula]|uniref:Uncharacterized protein n=1 Tax=Trichodelitschia bisporula TaxID=703511 RepID=A0A6G1HM31_9PEZI|nr:hypothetical protein EJ06DRAFT_158805 [Trichodelitschia bisporula]